MRLQPDRTRRRRFTPDTRRATQGQTAAARSRSLCKLIEEGSKLTALHIADCETEDHLLPQLAKSLSIIEGRPVGITEATYRAAREKLERDTEVAETKPAGGLEAELENEMRAVVLEFARERAKAEGKRGVGSAVWKMIPKYGPIETLRRLVSRPTSGLISGGD